MTDSQKKTRPIRGAMTAMVTPFRGGEVDVSCLERLVDMQVDGGTDWLAPLGTTGEAPTLRDGERDRILETVLSRSAGRCGVMAGTGTNDTAETVRHTQRARAAGVDAVLVVAPCYNRPSQEGLYRHFATVAESVDLPIVLYNVPARTAVDMANDVVARLRTSYPHIVAMKDASGDVQRATDLAGRCDITVLSGEDTLTWPLMALGAAGVISVVSNLVPGLMKSLVTAAAQWDVGTVLPLHRKIHDLAASLAKFGTNPAPIKTAMALNGLLREEFRLPLCPVDGPARTGIEAVLRRHELMHREDR